MAEACSAKSESGNTKRGTQEWILENESESFSELELELELELERRSKCAML